MGLLVCGPELLGHHAELCRYLLEIFRISDQGRPRLCQSMESLSKQEHSIINSHCLFEPGRIRSGDHLVFQVGSAGIILQAPALYDTRESIDIQLSEIEAATAKPLSEQAGKTRIFI